MSTGPRERRTGLSSFSEIADLHRRLEQLAGVGNWPEVSRVTQRRDELLRAVKVREHAALFTEAQRINSRVLALAKQQQRAVGQQLSRLQRSREAARHYFEHTTNRVV